VLASQIYAKFVKGGISKAIAAQHLAEWLGLRTKYGLLKADDLEKRLPQYLREAIRYVTGKSHPALRWPHDEGAAHA
jgi:hypothetical protein